MLKGGLKNGLKYADVIARSLRQQMEIPVGVTCAVEESLTNIFIIHDRPIMLHVYILGFVLIDEVIFTVEVGFIFQVIFIFEVVLTF